MRLFTVFLAVVLSHTVPPAHAQRSNDNFYQQQQMQRQQQAAAEQSRRQQADMQRQQQDMARQQQAAMQRQMQAQQEQMRQRQQDMQRQAQESQQRLMAMRQNSDAQRDRLRNPPIPQGQRPATAPQTQTAQQQQALQQQTLQRQRATQMRQEQLTRLRQDRERRLGADRQQRVNQDARTSMRAQLAAQGAATRATAATVSQNRQSLARTQLIRTRLTAALQKQRIVMRQRLVRLQQTQKRLAEAARIKRTVLAAKVATATRLAAAKIFSSCPGGVCKTCSFHGDTLVLTREGYVPIKSMVAGKDWVWAKSEYTGETAWKPVTAHYQNPYEESVEVLIKSADGRQTQTLRSNRIHPFFVGAPASVGKDDLEAPQPRRGQAPHGEWITAEHLQPGHRLLENDEEWAEIAGIAIKRQPLTAFNLTVAEFHTYFVKAADANAEGAVWVHNDCKHSKPADPESKFNLPVIKPGTKEWAAAVSSLSSTNTKGNNFRTETASHAKALLQEARGAMDRRKMYTNAPYKKGYEVHNQQNVRELDAKNDLQHLNWRDGRARGHIYYETPN